MISACDWGISVAYRFCQSCLWFAKRGFSRGQGDIWYGFCPVFEELYGFAKILYPNGWCSFENWLVGEKGDGLKFFDFFWGVVAWCRV